jgi:hypothetical protein
MIGCATAPKPVENGRLSADEIRNRLVRTGTALHSFSAEGTITVNTPSMDQSAGFDLASRGADSVKMNVYGPFGITVGSAFFTRAEFIAYNALNNTVYRGLPEQQLKKIPFISEIPIELFMGTLQGIHLLNGSAVIDSVEVLDDGTYSFAVLNENGTYDSFRYSGGMDRITRCTRRAASGTVLWSVRYQYARNDEGRVVPEQVEVTIPEKDSSLLIEFGGISDSPDPGAFSLSYPEDAEVITIE